jgi:hypothetical protein
MRNPARFRLITLLAAAAATASCTSPANVAGTYSVDVTDEGNGCSFAGWVEGSDAAGIPVVITQSSSSITVAVNGAAGVLIAAVIGTNSFTGTVSGDSFGATQDGTRALGSGGCAYTINGEISGSLSTNSINGTITYSAKTNGDASCGSITGCQSVQDYDGSRPPP